MSKPKTVESLKQEVDRRVYSIQQTKSYLKHQFKNLIIKGDNYKSKLIFIEGEAGIGKTSIQKQLLKEMKEEILAMKDVAYPECLAHFKEHGGQLIVKNYAANDAQDFSGMPIKPEQDKNGMYIQTYSNPFPQYGYGIFFQDEANRVTDPQLKTVQLSLWVDRAVNGNSLGKGYLQVLAGNTFDDKNYKTSKQDDAAYSDRYVIIHLRPTYEEVMSYLGSAYPDHPMIGFLQENKTFISLFNSNNTGFSPRSLDYYMNETDLIISNYEENRELVDMITYAYFKDQAPSFLKYLADDVDVNFQRILKDSNVANKIKRHDSALMNALLVQMEQHFATTVKTSEITEHDVKTASLVLSKFNKETQHLFAEWLVSMTGKTKVNLVDEISKIDPKFFKVLSGIEKAFESSTRIG